MQLLQNIMVTKDIINDRIPPYIRVQRHMVAVNFYLTVEIEGEIYLVLYDYDPVWDAWYPFNFNPLYKDINHFSIEKTYKSLIEENHSYASINLSMAVTRAISELKSRIGGIDFLIEPLKYSLREYELKYSKTKKRYTMYRFLNFIITDISNPSKAIDVSTGCKLVKLSEIKNIPNIISNVYVIVEKNLEQLKKCAIKIYK